MEEKMRAVKIMEDKKTTMVNKKNVLHETTPFFFLRSFMGESPNEKRNGLWVASCQFWLNEFVKVGRLFSFTFCKEKKEKERSQGKESELRGLKGRDRKESI